MDQDGRVTMFGGSEKNDLGGGKGKRSKKALESDDESPNSRGKGASRKRLRLDEPTATLSHPAKGTSGRPRQDAGNDDLAVLPIRTSGPRQRKPHLTAQEKRMEESAKRVAANREKWEAALVARYQANRGEDVQAAETYWHNPIDAQDRGYVLYNLHTMHHDEPTAFLSMNYPCRISVPEILDGFEFPSMDHFMGWNMAKYFQLAAPIVVDRVSSHELINAFLNWVQPKDVFIYLRQFIDGASKIDANWSKMWEPAWKAAFVLVAKKGLRAKFLDSPYLLQCLMKTANYDIIEASTSNFTGVGYRGLAAHKHRSSWGEKKMDQALQAVRDELRNKVPLDGLSQPWPTKLFPEAFWFRKSVHHTARVLEDKMRREQAKRLKLKQAQLAARQKGGADEEGEGGRGDAVARQGSAGVAGSAGGEHDEDGRFKTDPDSDC